MKLAFVLVMTWANSAQSESAQSDFFSQSHPLLTSSNIRASPLTPPRPYGRARIATDPTDQITRQEDDRFSHQRMDMSRLNHSSEILDLSSVLPENDLDDDEIQLTVNIPSVENHDDGTHNYAKRCLKTGTTIVGLRAQGSIILAADTRATEGSVVADTRCEKVHRLSRNVWCCGAGTSADLDALTRKVRYAFLLRNKIRESIGNDGFSYRYGQDADGDTMHYEEMTFRSEEEIDINQTLGDVSISSICHMIREELTRGGGEIGANLVLGGVDPFTKQPILTAIHPHGSIDVIPYTALGSGGLAAMGVLEAGYRGNMSLDDGIKLVKDAVLAGVKNDLGSGSQVSYWKGTLTGLALVYISDFCAFFSY